MTDGMMLRYPVLQECSCIRLRDNFAASRASRTSCFVEAEEMAMPSGGGLPQGRGAQDPTVSESWRDREGKGPQAAALQWRPTVLGGGGAAGSRRHMARGGPALPLSFPPR